MRQTFVHLKHTVFTVHRHEVLWLDQWQHQLLLFLATVTRSVDVVHLTVDNVSASFFKLVNHAVNRLCVTRNWWTWEDNCVIRLDWNLLVRTIGDTGKSGHRFTLRTRWQNQHFVRWEAVDFVCINQHLLWNVQVAKCQTVGNGTFHWTTEDSNLTTVGKGSFSCHLHTWHVWGERGENNATINFIKQLINRLTNPTLWLWKFISFSVCWVRHQ